MEAGTPGLWSVKMEFNPATFGGLDFDTNLMNGLNGEHMEHDDKTWEFGIVWRCLMDLDVSSFFQTSPMLLCVFVGY